MCTCLHALNLPSLFQHVVQLKIVYGTEEDVALAVRCRPHAFIANCVSAFSAVAKRDRDHLGKSTDFCGFLRQECINELKGAMCFC